MFRNQNIIVIVVTFFATIISLYISVKIGKYELRDVALALTGFISITAIILGYLSFYRTEKNQKKIDENIEKLDKLRKLLQNTAQQDKLSWLLNEEQLRLLEQAKEKSQEIWVVSPDPSNDTGDSPWVAIIRNNIGDGIIYYYIAPKTDSLDGAIKGLKTVFRDNLDQCHVVKLNKNDFEILPHEHLVIYDPHNHHDESDCFAELDIEEKGWWICLPKNKHNMVITKLLPLIDESIPLSKL